MQAVAFKTETENRGAKKVKDFKIYSKNEINDR